MLKVFVIDVAKQAQMGKILEKEVTSVYQPKPIQPTTSRQSVGSRSSIGQPPQPAVSANPTMDFFSRLDTSLSQQSKPIQHIQQPKNKLSKDLEQFDML
jgi:hypothetical protein